MPNEGLIDGKMVVDSLVSSSSCDCKGCINDDYKGKFEQASAPTVEQIPDGKWGWWWNTTDSLMIQDRNRGGTMYGAECSAL